MVETTFEQDTVFALKNANSAKKSRDHHRYSTPAPLRHTKRGYPKQLPIAIPKIDVRTNYPMEVEELCQVLEAMLKRRLAEEQMTEMEELAIAA